MTSRLLMLGALLLGVACSRAESPATEPLDVPSKLVGVVVAVDSAGLGNVRSFTLRRRGETFEVRIDESITYSFPPAHLNDHLATSQPVRVELERRDDGLYALAIEDA